MNERATENFLDSNFMIHRKKNAAFTFVIQKKYLKMTMHPVYFQKILVGPFAEKESLALRSLVGTSAKLQNIL